MGGSTGTRIAGGGELLGGAALSLMGMPEVGIPMMIGGGAGAATGNWKPEAIGGGVGAGMGGLGALLPMLTGSAAAVPAGAAPGVADILGGNAVGAGLSGLGTPGAGTVLAPAAAEPGSTAMQMATPSAGASLGGMLSGAAQSPYTQLAAKLLPSLMQQQPRGAMPAPPAPRTGAPQTAPVDIAGSLNPQGFKLASPAERLAMTYRMIG